MEPTTSMPVVLVVEDNRADRVLIEEGIKLGLLHASFHFAEDGVQAMQFLRREGDYGQAPRPEIVLLDLNLPRKDGREVLCEIKSDPQLRDLPVVIFSTSSRPEDVIRLYEQGALSYLTKPEDLYQYLSVIQGLVSWVQRFATEKKGSIPTRSYR